MRFFLDSAEENQTDDLALHGELSGLWNGQPVVLASEAEFRRFISAWAVNDPNGAWVPQGVRVDHGGDALVYDDGENDPEEFQFVRYDDNGDALYEVSGWNLKGVNE